MSSTSERCTVWSGAIDDAHPQLVALLDPVERRRLDRFRAADDARRHLVGAAMSRLLASADLDLGADRIVVDRRCRTCGEPHGRPVIDGFHHSVAHAGDQVVVAVAGKEGVGVDIERIVGNHTVDRLKERVLTPAEQDRLDEVAPQDKPRWFTTVWTRKEAIGKASGLGIAVSFRSIQVTDPDERSGIGRWPDDEGLQARSTWISGLDAPAGYRSAIALLDRPASEPVVAQRSGSELLARAASDLASGVVPDSAMLRSLVAHR